MNTRDDLVQQLKDKEYRDAFVASQIDVGLPYQIRALRGEMGQKEFAELIGMAQPRISNIERPGYANLTLTTLKRIASGCDVALIVKFVPFSELAEWADSFSPDSFSVPSFANDTKLFRGSALQSSGEEGQAPSSIIDLHKALNAAKAPEGNSLLRRNAFYASIDAPEYKARREFVERVSRDDDLRKAA